MASNAEQRKIEIIADGKKFNASMKEMQAAVSILNNQLKKLPQGTQEFRDKAKELDQVKGNLDRVKQEAYGTSSAMKQLTTMLGGVGLAMGGITVANKLIGFFSSASETAKQFEVALDSLQSITGATAQDMVFYEEMARSIGATTTLSASQAAEAFQLMGSAKPDLLAVKESLVEVTQEAVTLAEAAKITLPEAAQALASTMNQFNVPASEANRIINALAAGSVAGAAEIPDLTAAIDKGGLAAANYNVSVEETIALTELLSTKNLKGAEAGTQLKNVLLTMSTIQALPPNAIDQLNAFGVNLDLVADKSVPMNERLRELSKISVDAAAMVKVFGKENVNAAGTILQSVGAFEDLTTAVTGTQTAVEQAATNTDNYQSALKALNSATEDIKISIGNGINVVLRFLVETLTKVILGLKEAPKFIRENKDLFIAFGVALVSFNAATIASTAATVAHVAVEKGRAIAVNASVIAQRLLNAAMTANPIGLIVKAVGLLVSGFVVLYNRSETVRAGISGLAAVAKEVFAIIQDTIGGFVGGFKKVIDGDFKGGLTDIGKAIINTSPVGLAFQEGDRLAGAFAKGYKDKLKEGQEEQKDTLEEGVAEQVAIEEKKGEEVLAVVEKQNAEALKKQQEHQKKLEAAQKAYHQSQIDAERELQKLKIEAMDEGIEKTLAKLDFEHEQKIAKLEEQRQEIIENELLTQQQKDEALAIYAEEQALLEEEKKVAEEESAAEQRELDLEKIMTDLEEEDELKKAVLEGQFINAVDAENQRNEAFLNLQQEFLRKKLAALEAAGKGETAQAIKIKNEIAKIEKEKADNAMKVIAEEEAFKANIREIGFQAAQDVVRGGIELLGEETKARKAAGAVFKAMQISDVIINGVKEVQGYWAAYSSIPVAGPIIAGLLTAAAVVRSGVAIKKITSQKFDKGGYTGSGMFVDSLGGLRDDSGYKVAGVVHEREWVAPAWMVESPKFANHIGYLEAARSRGGYATGGFTSAPNAVANSPAATQGQNAADRTSQVMESVYNVLLRIEMKLDGNHNDIRTWATDLKAVYSILDIRDGLQDLNKIETKARIQ